MTTTVPNAYSAFAVKHRAVVKSLRFFPYKYSINIKKMNDKTHSESASHRQNEAKDFFIQPITHVVHTYDYDY